MAKTKTAKTTHLKVATQVPQIHNLFSERMVPGIGLTSDILSDCIGQFFDLVLVRYPTVINLTEIPEKELADMANYVIGLAQVFYVNWSKFPQMVTKQRLRRA